jgi:hypothetical protein
LNAREQAEDCAGNQWLNRSALMKTARPIHFQIRITGFRGLSLSGGRNFSAIRAGRRRDSTYHRWLFSECHG